VTVQYGQEYIESLTYEQKVEKLGILHFPVYNFLRTAVVNYFCAHMKDAETFRQNFNFRNPNNLPLYIGKD